MDAASVGSSFSNYTGNAALGGSDFGAIKIDTQPLQDLATYTMLYNKAEYEQKQKTAEKNAQEIASLSNYDLSSGIEKDRNLLMSSYKELTDMVANDPTIFDYKKNPKGWLEYNKKKNELSTQIQSGKIRSVMNIARLKDINEEKDPELKAMKQKQLNDEINAKDIYTPLNVTPQYDLTTPEIPVPQMTTFDVVAVMPNQNVKETISVVDMRDINSKSGMIELGLLGFNLDQNSPEFKAKSKEEQAALIDNYNAQKAGGKLAILEQAKVYNDALASYKKQDGTIDVASMASKNPMLFGVMKAFNDYNTYVNGMKDKIKSGAFTDKLGKKLAFGNDNLNEYDYQPINFEDGISAKELVKVQMFAKASANKSTTAIQETDDALQYTVAAETKRHNIATENQNKAELAQKERQWQSTMTGTQNQVNGAMKRADRIYSDLEKLADKNGIITPDKLRNLNVEQLKYLGVEVPEERSADGTITSKAGYRPLDITPTGDNKNKEEYLIQVLNGEIKVMKGATKDAKVASGWRGTWDNTKSTNKFNVATNILNEELKNAGSKELNAYMGIDAPNGTGIVQNTDIKTSNSSSSSVDLSKVKGSATGPGGVKIYTLDGKTWINADGTPFKQ